MKKNLQSLAYFWSLLILFGLSTTSIKAQEWVPVSSPPANFLTDHTFGFSLEGMGYLVAGAIQGGSASDNFYQYDPMTDEFIQMEDDFPGGARGFAIGDTWNGKAYFGFGSNSGGLFNDLWVYDPANGSWTELAECPCAARRHPAMIANNGKVAVGMGNNASGNLKDWWVYDIATDSWTQGTDFPSSRRHHPYQFGVGDYMYAGLGHGADIYNTWYRYDTTSDTWDQMESLPGDGRVAGTQFSWNGKGYVLSGENENHLAFEVGEFWSYDPVTNAWEQLPSHPNTSRWAPASFVIDDEVYLFNGAVYVTPSSGFYPNDSYKFDLTQGQMSATTDLNKIEDYQIYPNPASDYLTIEKTGNSKHSGQFSIFNMLGTSVMSFEVNDKKEMDVSGLSNGVYFVRAEGEAGAVRIVIGK